MFEILAKILVVICRTTLNSEIVIRIMKNRGSESDKEFEKEYDKIIHKNRIITFIYYAAIIVGAWSWIFLDSVLLPW